jgi:hypothetical protein
MILICWIFTCRKEYETYKSGNFDDSSKLLAAKFLAISEKLSAVNKAAELRVSSFGSTLATVQEHLPGVLDTLSKRNEAMGLTVKNGSNSSSRSKDNGIAQKQQSSASKKVASKLSSKDPIKRVFDHLS